MSPPFVRFASSSRRVSSPDEPGLADQLLRSPSFADHGQQDEDPARRRFRPSSVYLRQVRRGGERTKEGWHAAGRQEADNPGAMYAEDAGLLPRSSTEARSRILSPRRWFVRQPSWSSTSSAGSAFGSLPSWSASSLLSSFSSPQRAVDPVPFSSSPAGRLHPTDNLRQYVKRAAAGFFPFPPLAPHKSARETLERAYEVLHQTRLTLPRLERVERIRSSTWRHEVNAHLDQIPSAPVAILTHDGPFFRLAAKDFLSEAVLFPNLSPTVAAAAFWLHEQVLLTALSVLDAVRDTQSEFEFCKVTTKLPADRVGDDLYPTSPYPPSKSQTLALLSARDTTDRVLLVEVVEPEQGLLGAFVKAEEDWELGVPFRDRRREMRPAPSRVHANLLQAHLFASCKENRVSHFILTDTHSYVFGEIHLAPALRREIDDDSPAPSAAGRGQVVGVEVGAQATDDFRRVGKEGTEGVMRVRKALHFTAKNPSAFESLVAFLVKAYDTTRGERRTGIDIWTPPPPVPPKGRR